METSIVYYVVIACGGLVNLWPWKVFLTFPEGANMEAGKRKSAASVLAQSRGST